MMIKKIIRQVFLKEMKTQFLNLIIYPPSLGAKRTSSEEFKSLGFYISDHPLNEFEETFNQLKIINFNEFRDNNDNERP